MSSEIERHFRRGRARNARGALTAAFHAGKKALKLIQYDNEASYLSNEERQFAIERLLIVFGEALKDVPTDLLIEVAPQTNWLGPKSFRYLAAHWYDSGLDHRLIWRALQQELPEMVNSIEVWLTNQLSSD